MELNIFHPPLTVDKAGCHSNPRRCDCHMARLTKKCYCHQAMSIQRGTIVLSTQYNSSSEQLVVLGTLTLANLYFEEHIYIIRRYYNVRLFTLFSTQDDKKSPINFGENTSLYFLWYLLYFLPTCVHLWLFVSKLFYNKWFKQRWMIDI